MKKSRRVVRPPRPKHVPGIARVIGLQMVSAVGNVEVRATTGL